MKIVIIPGTIVLTEKDVQRERGKLEYVMGWGREGEECTKGHDRRSLLLLFFWRRGGGGGCQ